MAAITISAAGGNWNSTATWVGGVIPTTSDHVVGDATSGQLTVNVNATVQYVDFTLYTNTLTINAGVTLSLSLASSTNTWGASMNFAGTGTVQLNAVASTWVQNTTNRVPNLNMIGTVTRTLSTNVYIGGTFSYSNLPTINGNTIYVGGSFTANTGNFSLGITGTTSIELDGSGMIAAASRVPVTITGDYNTYGMGLYLADDTTFTYNSGAAPSLFNLILNKELLSSNTYNIDTNQTINLFLTSIISATGVDLTVNLLSPLSLNLLTILTMPNEFTTRNVVPNIIFTGNSVSATTLNICPTWRTTSASTNPPTSDALTFRGNDISWDPAYTHTIGSMILDGGGIPTIPQFKSSSPGTPVQINLGSKITSQIIDYDFIDIDASGGDEIVAINGTLTNTTNVTNVYPSGGGGGETTHISVS